MLVSIKKEGNSTTWDKTLDITELTKPDRGKKILYDLTFMWNL